MKNALIALLFTAGIVSAQTPPPITYTIEADYQQTQSLPDQSFQQGAGVRLRYKLMSNGGYLSLAGLTGKWQGRSSVTSTNYITQTTATTVTNVTPNYFEFDLDYTATGTAVANWVYSMITTYNSNDYVMGEGRLDIQSSAWTGAGAAIAADSCVTKIIAGTGISLDPSSGLGDVTISATGGGGGGDVTSVAGRTGDVVIVSGDLADFASTVEANPSVASNTLKVSYTDAAKVAGIEAGATSNSTDAVLLARANHTGTQAASTIVDFQSAVSTNGDVVANSAKVSYSDAGNVVLKDGTVAMTGNLDLGTSDIISGVETDSVAVIAGAALADRAYVYLSGTSNPNESGSIIVQGGSGSTGDDAGSIAFRTVAAGGGVPTTRMLIRRDGRVSNVTDFYATTLHGDGSQLTGVITSVPTFFTFTDGTTMSNGVYLGTNSIVFSKGGTNAFLRLPW